MKHLLIVALLAATAGAAPGPAGKTTVKWYGHAAFEIDLPSGKTILVDPWLANPSNPSGKRRLPWPRECASTWRSYANRAREHGLVQ